MRMLRLGIVAFCSAAALWLSAATAVPGCTVLTNDALPDDAGTFEGGGDAATTGCSSCVELECVGPWSVCLTDSRCVALKGCDNPFGESQASRDQCFCTTADAAAPSADRDAGADPLSAYAAYASCNDARTCGKCATDCVDSCAGGGRKTTAGSCGDTDAGPTDDAGTDSGAGDGGDAGVPVDASIPETPSLVDRCQACVSDKCGEAKKLCALGSECTAFLSCANGCVDAACVEACGKSHASGRTSALELSSCTLTSCRSACGL